MTSQAGGRIRLFAHNGDLHGIGGRWELSLGRRQSIRKADSWHALCALLSRLSRLNTRTRAQCRGQVGDSLEAHRAGIDNHVLRAPRKPLVDMGLERGLQC